jgi:hypothetical protein
LRSPDTQDQLAALPAAGEVLERRRRLLQRDGRIRVRELIPVLFSRLETVI